MKLKLWAGAIMLALSLLVQPLLAGQAEDAIGRGDYTTALKLISPLAEQGDAHAQLVTLFPTEERELGFRFPMGAPPPDLQPKNDSTLVGAAFRQYNTVTSAYNYISSRFGLTDEPGHNPLDVIRGTKYEQNYLMRFVDSFSLAETKLRMGQIDQEIRDKQRIHSVGLGGTVMSIVAGVLDPLIAFPIMALWFLLRKLRKRNAAALTS